LPLCASPRVVLRIFHTSMPSGITIDPVLAADLPADTIWIDLLNPTPAEEKLVEHAIGLSVPTRDEMAEIEQSSRLYEENGAIYMTATVLAGLDENDPISTPVSFVLTNKHLVTVRYADPKPIRSFADNLTRHPELLGNAMETLVRLLDAIVDRLADSLEQVASEIEQISKRVFRRAPDERGRRIPSLKLEALLVRIGNTQDLLAKARETAGSTARLLSFVSACSHFRGNTEQRDHIHSLSDDIESLTDHSGFLSNNITFLLDASLGLISIEQNAILKIFSVASVILLPPTLVGAIYGMNFERMPELKWVYGYPAALIVMLLSAALPYLYFRRRGWL
jgi:magnesium transporter